MNEPELPDFDDQDDSREIERAKSKMIMDFGLEQKRPERVTLEVLRQLIRDNPQRMTRAIRDWLRNR